MKSKELISKILHSDYGLPRLSQGPDKRVISTAFVEVDKQKTEPQSYALAYSDGRLPFDYVCSRPDSTTKTLVKNSSLSSIA